MERRGEGKRLSVLYLWLRTRGMEGIMCVCVEEMRTSSKPMRRARSSSG